MRFCSEILENPANAAAEFWSSSRPLSCFDSVYSETQVFKAANPPRSKSDGELVNLAVIESNSTFNWAWAPKKQIRETISANISLSSSPFSTSSMWRLKFSSWRISTWWIIFSMKLRCSSLNSRCSEFYYQIGKQFRGKTGPFSSELRKLMAWWYFSRRDWSLLQMRKLCREWMLERSSWSCKVRDCTTQLIHTFFKYASFWVGACGFCVTDWVAAGAVYHEMEGEAKAIEYS